MDTKKRRIIAYIDGFNLYYGLKSKGWKRYLWLNIQLLIENLIKPNSQLVYTKYFTSRVSATVREPNKPKRQSLYIDALSTLRNFEIYYGHYLIGGTRCPKCSYVKSSPSEKMTDVNISVEMMTDAFQDKFDVAFLISGDSDLYRPVLRIQELFPEKKVVVAFPPKRTSKHLCKTASAHFTIGRKKFAQSLFSNEIVTPGGFVLKKPPSWS